MLRHAIISGVLATIVFSLLIMLEPMVGIDNPPVWQTLAQMLRGSIVVGWILHFMVGIIFALVFLFVVSKLETFKISINIFLLGFMYGVLIFIPSAIIITLTNFDGILLIASLIGHIIFALVLSLYYSSVQRRRKSLL